MRMVKLTNMLGVVVCVLFSACVVNGWAADGEYDKLTTKKDTYLATESGEVIIGTDSPLSSGALLQVYGKNGGSVLFVDDYSTSVNNSFIVRDSKANTLLSVWNGGVFLPKKTDEEIKELSAGEGQLVYNTDKQSFVYWNGSEWRSLSAQQDEAKKEGSAEFKEVSKLSADDTSYNSIGWPSIGGDLGSGCPDGGSNDCLKVKINSGGGAYTLTWNYEVKMDARAKDYVTLKLQTHGGVPNDTWVTQDSSGKLTDGEGDGSSCKDGNPDTHKGDESGSRIVHVEYKDYYFPDDNGDDGIKKRDYFYIRLAAKKSNKSSNKLQAVLTGGYLNVYRGYKESDNTQLTGNSLPSDFCWTKPNSTVSTTTVNTFQGKDYISAASQSEDQAKKWCACIGQTYAGYENYITDKNKGMFEYKSTAKGSASGSSNYKTNGNCEKGCFDKVKCSK